MTNFIHSETKEKHNEVFRAYMQVISELGKQARNVSKKSMYDEVALRTKYSWEYVSKLITTQFRKNKCNSK
jgi:hypothetical protein